MVLALAQGEALTVLLALGVPRALREALTTALMLGHVLALSEALGLPVAAPLPLPHAVRLGERLLLGLWLLLRVALEEALLLQLAVPPAEAERDAHSVGVTLPTPLVLTLAGTLGVALGLHAALLLALEALKLTLEVVQAV